VSWPPPQHREFQDLEPVGPDDLLESGLWRIWPSATVRQIEDAKRLYRKYAEAWRTAHPRRQIPRLPRLTTLVDYAGGQDPAGRILLPAARAGRKGWRSMPIANSDFVPDPFPGIKAAGTLTPGSTGITATATAGPVVGSPRVGPTGLPDGAGRGREQVPVHSGDTSGMSDDLAAHASVIAVGPEEDYMATGAGDGSTGHFKRHPWQQGAS
jgi:hypothetical protein